jgi:hypothetical protein
MDDYTFERIHARDYSALQLDDLLIVAADSELVSAMIVGIKPLKNSRAIYVSLTDDRTSQIGHHLAEFREGNVFNIMYRVSENVLKGEVPIGELKSIADKSENAGDDHAFVLGKLEEAIQHYRPFC